jgi:lysophospholipase L1-like esterase
MKHILCYGDSNTWGSPPAPDEAAIASLKRYGEDVRWGGILRRELGEDYRVIEEGLNGRTTAYDDPMLGEYRSGKRFLPMFLESHQPLDLVIVLLGTNDLKSHLDLSPQQSAEGAGALVDMIQTLPIFPSFHIPKTLLICPPPIARLSLFADLFVGAAEKSRQLPALYRQQAERYGCAFLDAGQIITSSDGDGIHLEASEHRKLALAVAPLVQQIVA